VAHSNRAKPNRNALLGGVNRPVTVGRPDLRDTNGIPQLGSARAEAGYRLLLGGRPNCGNAEQHFADSSESGTQASFLVKLIRALDLWPTALAGGSAGARISTFAAREVHEGSPSDTTQPGSASKSPGLCHMQGLSIRHGLAKYFRIKRGMVGASSTIGQRWRRLFANSWPIG
jgi:hypothetical protein